MVYFLRYETPNCPVKIGYTEDASRLAARMRAYSTAAPWPVEGLAVAQHAGHACEQELHRILKPHNTRGEWFTPSIAVMTVVRYVKENPRVSPACILEVAREAMGELPAEKPIRKMSRSARRRRAQARLAEQIATGEVRIRTLTKD